MYATSDGQAANICTYFLVLVSDTSPMIIILSIQHSLGAICPDLRQCPFRLARFYFLSRQREPKFFFLTLVSAYVCT